MASVLFKISKHLCIGLNEHDTKFAQQSSNNGWWSSIYFELTSKKTVKCWWKVYCLINKIATLRRERVAVFAHDYTTSFADV